MMNRLLQRRAHMCRRDMSAAERAELDRGAVLPMVISLMVIGSFAVVGLLTFATTLYKIRPPIEVRDRSFWSAKSAMEMAMAKQRQFGPDGCYSPTDTITLNGFAASVTCTPTANYFGTGRGRFAVITTANEPASKQFYARGADPGPPPVKPLTGDVFVNGGYFDADTADIGVNGTVYTSNYASTATDPLRYQDGTAAPAACDAGVEPTMQFPNPGVDWIHVCQGAPWWTFAGDEDPSGNHQYPLLSPIPSYFRLGAGSTIGSCTVYYPGRYDALTLPAGDHYFASGVYYFEDTLTLEPGARVVAGEGRWGGCTVDAEAVFAPGAPRDHEITGKGSTFLLGATARIVGTDASFRINRRVSTPQTRGTETVAIRSVNFGSAPTGPQAVEIPNDVVYVADEYDAANPACDASIETVRCLQHAANHTVTITTGNTASYTASSLAPSDKILEFVQTTPAASSEIVTDGYVFVPNGKVELTGEGNSDYVNRLTGGVVAARFEMEYNVLPANPADWFMGVLDEPIQRQVQLYVEVDAGNGNFTTSRAQLEVHIDDSYAINGWTVDPNTGSASGTTAPATTTTVPPGPTTTTTTTPTTTTTTTTTTTLPGPPLYDYCANNGGAWTFNWGPGLWDAEYFTDQNLSSTPVLDTDSSVNFNWGNAGPHQLDPQVNDFSIRWTQQINVAADCMIDIRAGGDDGFRLWVDGDPKIDNWSDHAYLTARHDDLVLTTGLHTVTMEWYENGGQARATLEWRES